MSVFLFSKGFDIKLSGPIRPFHPFIFEKNVVMLHCAEVHIGVSGRVRVQPLCCATSIEGDQGIPQ